MPNLKENSQIEGFDVVVKNEDDTKIIKKKNPNKKSGGFQSFGLSHPVINGLQKRGYKVPTPIQRKTIPLILQGRDVVAMARTGSGKTACFLIPMFEKLKRRTITSKGARAVILSPTRELAAQTLKFIRELGKFTDLKAISILGGDSINHQFGSIHENPDIIVATPGRFLHICIEMDLKLSSVDYIVFDEADRLFEMGFGDQIKELLDRLPEARQTLLFSATLPKMLVDFAKAGLSNPALVRLDVDLKIPDALELAFVYVRPEEKPAALICTLQALPKDSQTLVFAATKHHVEYLHMLLDKAGISNTFIYSDLDSAARKINTAKFRLKKCSVLIVTDLAARGVDIPNLNYVINYHFPAKAKLFVHRVGRCARAGRSGVAISLIAIDECPYVLDLHLFLGRPLNLLPLNSKPETEKMAFGRIPEDAILAQHSEILEWHESDDFDSILKVCRNAYSKYLKSRPGASKESVRRVKSIDFVNIGFYPLFRTDGNNMEKINLLDRMKNYKPRNTIFDLIAGANPKSLAALNSAKKAHAKLIKEFHFKKYQRDKEEAEENFTEENEDYEEVVNTRKRKAKNEEKIVKKPKFKDDEYYVPHFAADNYIEKELAVNNFVDQANKATFDITGDNEDGFKTQRQLKRWDQKKKRIVEVPNKKFTKIKTESGNWISASYKSNLYAKWKERSKVQNAEESEGDEDETEDQNGKGKGKGKPKFNKNKLPKLPNAKKRKRKNDDKTEKPRNELKRPEQILKARKELRKKQFKSLPKNVRNKMTNKNNKNNNKNRSRR